MAITLDDYKPYDAGPGSSVSEDGWRQFAKYWRGDGVIRGVGNQMDTYGNSTGMYAFVRDGECWIQGNWGKCINWAGLPIAPSHATLGRRDLVIVRNDFVNNRIEFDVLTGTPAASPVYPTVTQNTSIWEIQLATVVVNAAVVTITAGNVTPVQRFTDGSARYTVDSSYQTVTTGTATAIDFDVAVFDSSEISRPSLHEWKILRAGFWLIVFNIYWDNPNQTGTRECWIQRGSAPTNRLGWIISAASGSGGTAQNVVAMDRFAVNDIIEARGQHSAGVGVQVLGTTTSNQGTSLALWWLGP
jgi:hypothetical protein